MTYVDDRRWAKKKINLNRYTIRTGTCTWIYIGKTRTRHIRRDILYVIILYCLNNISNHCSAKAVIIIKIDLAWGAIVGGISFQRTSIDYVLKVRMKKRTEIRKTRYAAVRKRARLNKQTNTIYILYLMRATPRHGRREGVVRFVKTLRRHYIESLHPSLPMFSERIRLARVIHQVTWLRLNCLVGGGGKRTSMYSKGFTVCFYPPRIDLYTYLWLYRGCIFFSIHVFSQNKAWFSCSVSFVKPVSKHFRGGTVPFTRRSTRDNHAPCTVCT